MAESQFQEIDVPEGEDFNPIPAMVEDRNALSSQLNQEMERFDTSRKTAEDTLEAFVRDAMPKEKPERIGVPKWEDSDEYKNAKIGRWGMGSGFALLIASLVGPMFMRTGAKGAMSALTAAINGWNAGDSAKWNQARDDYDRHVKWVHEQNEQFYKEWKALNDKKYNDYKEKLHSAQMFFTQHGMQVKGLYSDLAQMDRAILAAYKAGKKTQPIGKPTREQQREKDFNKAKSAAEQNGEAFPWKSPTEWEQVGNWHPAGWKAPNPKKASGLDLGLPKPEHSGGAIWNQAFAAAKKQNPGASDEDIKQALIKKGFDPAK